MEKQKSLVLEIRKLSEDLCDGIEQLQRACYPYMADHELINADMARRQLEIFPLGQTVALDLTNGERKVVGMNSGLLMNFDFDEPGHSFQSVTGNLSFSTHDPEGEYYYGSDICVHPDYRRQGLGRKLYQSRKDICVELGKKGILAGGMLVGYHRYKDSMAVEDYVEKVVAGEIADPTLTFQIKCGFTVKGVLHDYIEDESCCNAAALIYWSAPRED